jgi:hypothetical protein
MPCLDDGPLIEADRRADEARSYAVSLKKDIGFLEAILCAVMSVLDNASKVYGEPLDGNVVAQVFERANWIEAGVTRQQAAEWWTTHKMRDHQRREAEAREKTRLEAEAQAKRTKKELCIEMTKHYDSEDYPEGANIDLVNRESVEQLRDILTEWLNETK